MECQALYIFFLKTKNNISMLSATFLNGALTLEAQRQLWEITFYFTSVILLLIFSEKVRRGISCEANISHESLIFSEKLTNKLDCYLL